MAGETRRAHTEGRASTPTRRDARRETAATDTERQPRPTDPRVVRSRDRVLAATLELLTESGLSDLTIDEIASRSGVAKTTIYRHWSDRTTLVVDACMRMTDGDQDPPDTGSLEGDLESLLAELADLLHTARWSSIMPSIMDSAERDQRIADLHSRLQIWHAAPMRAVLERAVHRGQLPAGVDTDAMAAALRGPLYYRRWYTREPIDAPFISLVLRGVLAAAGPPEAAGSVVGTGSRAGN